MCTNANLVRLSVAILLVAFAGSLCGIAFPAVGQTEYKWQSPQLPLYGHIEYNRTEYFGLWQRCLLWNTTRVHEDNTREPLQGHQECWKTLGNNATSGHSDVSDSELVAQLGTAKWVGAANEGLQLIAVGLGIFMCCCPRSCLPLLQTCLCFSSLLCTGGLVVMSHNMVSRLNDVSQFHPLDLCPSLLKSACEAAGVQETVQMQNWALGPSVYAIGASGLLMLLTFMLVCKGWMGTMKQQRQMTLNSDYAYRSMA